MRLFSPFEKFSQIPVNGDYGPHSATLCRSTIRNPGPWDGTQPLQALVEPDYELIIDRRL